MHHHPQALPPFTNLSLLRSSAKGSALSNEDYIKRHHVEVYLKDVIRLAITYVLVLHEASHFPSYAVQCSVVRCCN